LKRTRSESDPEPDWPRRPLAELSESTHNSGGGDSTRPCVPQQGCLDEDAVTPPRPGEAPDKMEVMLPLAAPAQPGSDCLLVADAKETSAPEAADGIGESARPCVPLHGSSHESTVDAPRSDEAQSKKGAQPPPIASARCGPDCRLAATSRDTSSTGVKTQRDAPRDRAVEGADTAGATAILAQPTTEPLMAPCPMEMRATPQEVSPSDRTAGCLSEALGAWLWGWHAGSQSSRPTDATTSIVAAAMYMKHGGSSPENTMAKEGNHMENNDTEAVAGAGEPKGPFPLRPAGALKNPSHDTARAAAQAERLDRFEQAVYCSPVCIRGGRARFSSRRFSRGGLNSPSVL